MNASDFEKNRIRIPHRSALPLNRSNMPSSYEISLKHYTQNRSVRIPEDLGPQQSLKGFDPAYRNIIDYIVRITYRIWETDDREVDYIGQCYAPDSVVFDDYGLQKGSKKIISDTYHTTAAFPDIVLDAEEVIWAGNDEIGFHTSHLTRIIGTNTGESRYGAAKGTRVHFLVIANCVALENDIFLEHVLYNTSAMLKQMGVDPWKEAERLALDQPPGWPRSEAVWNHLKTSASPSLPISDQDPVAGFDPDAYSRSLHENVWNKDGSSINAYYKDDFVFEGTTDRWFSGKEAYTQYIREIREVFPDLKLGVDEVYWMGNDSEGWLISTRWSAEGTHLGDGIYRQPTGRACQIWGITQWLMKDGLIEKEWQLFNEFDLMMQIVSAG
jgi:hypothetical protein